MKKTLFIIVTCFAWSFSYSQSVLKYNKVQVKYSDLDLTGSPFNQLPSNFGETFDQEYEFQFKLIKKETGEIIYTRNRSGNYLYNSFKVGTISNEINSNTYDLFFDQNRMKEIAPLAPDGIYNSNGEIITIVNHILYRIEDSNFNGIDDNFEADLDGDGNTDAGKSDIDGDGIVDEYDNDKDGDGLPKNDRCENGGIGWSNNCFYSPLDTDDSNPDSDGDGVIDGLDMDYLASWVTETEEGSGIAKDSDNDGFADYYDNDADGDGLFKYRSDTDDSNPDIDGNGVIDGEEVDTDNDGYTDYAEVLAGTDPFYPGDTPSSGPIYPDLESAIFGSNSTIIRNFDSVSGDITFNIEPDTTYDLVVDLLYQDASQVSNTVLTFTTPSSPIFQAPKEFEPINTKLLSFNYSNFDDEQNKIGTYGFKGSLQNQYLTAFSDSHPEETLYGYFEPGTEYTNTGPQFVNRYPVKFKLIGDNDLPYTWTEIQSVTLSLLDSESNPISSGILTGTLTREVNDEGFVSFDDLKITQNGSYKIVATVDDTSVTYTTAQIEIKQDPEDFKNPAGFILRPGSTVVAGNSVTLYIDPVDSDGKVLVGYDEKTRGYLENYSFSMSYNINFKLFKPSGSQIYPSNTPRIEKSSANENIIVVPVDSYLAENGPYSVSFTLQKAFDTPTFDISGTFNVELPPDYGQSSLSTSKKNVGGDGLDSATITMQLKDASGTNFTSPSSASITFQLISGTASLSDVTDNNNGTYSVEVSSTSLGEVKIGAKIDGVTLIGYYCWDAYYDESLGYNVRGGCEWRDEIITLNFVPGEPSLVESKLSIDKDVLKPDNEAFTYVDLALKDAVGHIVTNLSDYSISVQTDLGTLGDLNDNGNGIVTFRFSPGEVPGIATINAFIGDQRIDDELRVIISGSQGLVLDNNLSDLSAGENFDLNVNLIDGLGNTITSGTGTISLQLYDNSNPELILLGTATANLVNGVASFSSLSINKSVSDLKLQILSDNPDHVESLTNAFSIKPSSIDFTKTDIYFGRRTLASDDSSIIPITIQLYDTYGNRVTDLSNNTIALSTTASHTITTPDVSSNGLITANLTTNAISETIDLIVGIDSYSTTISHNLKGVELCPGSSIVLESVNYDYEYQWFKDDTPIDNGIGRTITVSDSGIYSVQTTNPQTCDSFIEDYFLVRVLDDTAPIITTSEATSIFSNIDQNGNWIESLTITSSETIKPSRWYKDGVILPDQTSSTLVINEPGTYVAQYEITDGCYSQSSNPLTFTYNSLPVIYGPDYIDDSKAVSFIASTSPNETNPWAVDSDNVSITNEGILSIINSSDQSYDFELTFTDVNDKIATKTVTYSPAPVITISNGDIPIKTPSTTSNLNDSQSIPFITVCTNQPDIQLLGSGSPKTFTEDDGTSSLIAWNVETVEDTGDADDEAVATILDTGILTIHSTGTVRVSYTNSFDLTAYLDVIIEDPKLDGVRTNDNGDILLLVGETVSLNYLLHEEVLSGTWSISDQSHVQLSGEDLTGLTAGLASLTPNSDFGLCVGNQPINIIVSEAPDVEIDIDDDEIKTTGSLVTFNLTEESADFDVSKIKLKGNLRLNNFNRNDSREYRAEIIPNDNASNLDVEISVPAYRFRSQQGVLNRINVVKKIISVKESDLKDGIYDFSSSLGPDFTPGKVSNYELVDNDGSTIEIPTGSSKIEAIGKANRLKNYYVKDNFKFKVKATNNLNLTTLHDVVINVIEEQDADGIPGIIERKLSGFSGHLSGDKIDDEGEPDWDKNGVPDRLQSNIAHTPFGRLDKFQKVIDYVSNQSSIDDLSPDDYARVMVGVKGDDDSYSLDSKAELFGLSTGNNPDVIVRGGQQVADFGSGLLTFGAGPIGDEGLTDIDPNRDGVQVQFILEFNTPIPGNTFLKQDNNGDWKSFTALDSSVDGAVLTKTDDGKISEMVVTITDNGPWDSDERVGYVLDPGGIASASSYVNAPDEIYNIASNGPSPIKPVFSGTGEPGAEITLDFSQYIGAKSYTGTVDSDGNWSFRSDFEFIDGIYQPTVTVSNDLGGVATASPTYIIDGTAPVITLTGDATVTIEVGNTYTDAGATATDNYDGDITSSIVTVNPVDTS
ncbi:MAG: DUF5011 domain-containing protein, partial [Flavobacteriaceae bacterium]|nr:DUF5011 domain-containing protein [Flavobacteriaceae bacterium]